MLYEVITPFWGEPVVFAEAIGIVSGEVLDILEPLPHRWQFDDKGSQPKKESYNFV